MKNKIHHNNRRKASSMIEVTVALFILASLITAVTKVTILTAHQRRAVERRQLAFSETANLMERAAATPWNETTTQQFAKFKLSSILQQQLPTATLRIEVDEIPQPLPAKRITIEVFWKNAVGRQVEPARLVSWKYAQPPAASLEPTINGASP